MAQEGAEGSVPGRGQVVSDQPRRCHRYANAADVLPSELLREVQRHFVGTLYVGSEDVFQEEREKLVLALKAKHVSVREIASMAGITKRRVQQIVRSAKDQSKKAC